MKTLKENLEDELKYLRNSIKEIEQLKRDDKVNLFEEKKLLEVKHETRIHMRLCEIERLEERKKVIESRIKYNLKED